jgi:hypothetical protein
MLFELSKMISMFGSARVVKSAVSSANEDFADTPKRTHNKHKGMNKVNLYSFIFFLSDYQSRGTSSINVALVFIFIWATHSSLMSLQ